jgi:hypothetical protein
VRDPGRNLLSLRCYYDIYIKETFIWSEIKSQIYSDIPKLHPWILFNVEMPEVPLSDPSRLYKSILGKKKGQIDAADYGMPNSSHYSTRTLLPGQACLVVPSSSTTHPRD